MKNPVSAASIAALAAVAGCALSGCSVSTPAPADSAQATVPAIAQPATAQPATAQARDSAQARATDSPSSAAGGGMATREACELFNKLVVDYAAVPPTDSNGYEDVYLKAQDAKDRVSGDLQGLFASLGLLAIDHSSAAGTGSKPAKESQDAVRDAVFANSAACTAEGVTLRL